MGTLVLCIIYCPICGNLDEISVNKVGQVVEYTIGKCSYILRIFQARNEFTEFWDPRSGALDTANVECELWNWSNKLGDSQRYSIIVDTEPDFIKLWGWYRC